MALRSWYFWQNFFTDCHDFTLSSILPSKTSKRFIVASFLVCLQLKCEQKNYKDDLGTLIWNDRKHLSLDSRDRSKQNLTFCVLLTTNLRFREWPYLSLSSESQKKETLVAKGRTQLCLIISRRLFPPSRSISFPLSRSKSCTNWAVIGCSIGVLGNVTPLASLWYPETSDNETMSCVQITSTRNKTAGLLMLVSQDSPRNASCFRVRYGWVTRIRKHGLPRREGLCSKQAATWQERSLSSHLQPCVQWEQVSTSNALHMTTHACEVESLFVLKHSLDGSWCKFICAPDKTSKENSKIYTWNPTVLTSREKANGPSFWLPFWVGHLTCFFRFFCNHSFC